MNIKLGELLRDIHNGKVVLPDFQRCFVWGPEAINALRKDNLKKFMELRKKFILDEIQRRVSLITVSVREYYG